MGLRNNKIHNNEINYEIINNIMKINYIYIIIKE